MLKDDELKGSGNSYDFGARIYDPRLGRWLSVDPCLKDYTPFSTYSFGLNNPTIFRDEEGKWIKGLDGNAVTYTIDEKGIVTWSSNASEDIIRLGTMMLKVTKGVEELNKMRDANYPINVKIDNERPMYWDKVLKRNVSEPGENTELLFGETMPVYDENHKITEMSITIYEKSVEEFKKTTYVPMTKATMGKTIEIAGETVKSWEYSKEEIMASVAVHEGTHSTDEGSIGDDKTYEQKEEKPQRNQLEYLKQIKESKKK